MIPEYFFALREDLKDQKQFLPTRGEPQATGWDVRAAMEGSLTLQSGQKALIPLGIRGMCPAGYWYQLMPRSSTFHKKSLHYLVGTIDETFEGQLQFSCQFIPDPSDASPLQINFGDAIGQLIPVKRLEMQITELSNEELDKKYAARDGFRKTGGFGSTTKP